MITILSHPEHSPEERAKVCSLMPNTLKAECTKAIVPPSSRAQRDSEKNPGILRSIVQSIREVLRIFLRFIDVFGLLTPENALSIAHSSSSIAASSSATIIGDVVIHYRAHAFYPPDVKIAAGQTVTWINDGEEAFWPAGDDHPTHIVYDGGAFDPQAPVGAGKNWSFTFTEKGTWGFHDHLYPRAVGSVVVK
jgi:plastocyanin